MNFSFIRISLVLAVSNIYRTCAFEVCDFFHRSCVFSTNKGLVNDPGLGRFVTVEDGCMVPPELPIE